MEDAKRIKKLLQGDLVGQVSKGRARYTGYCGVCNEEIIGFSDVDIEEAEKDCLEKLKEHVEKNHVSARKWMEKFEKLVGALEDKSSLDYSGHVMKAQE